MRTLGIAWTALILASCATGEPMRVPPGAPNTICMPCGNDCHYPCTPGGDAKPAAPRPASPAAAARADPPAGYYASEQSVTLSTSTPGATIHYTTDGSEPTASSPVYTGPIPVTGDTTIKSMVVAPGLPGSEVATSAYVVAPPPPAPPPPPPPPPPPEVPPAAPAPPPRVVVTKEKLELAEKVYFDTGKATIQPKSHGLLDEVAQVLKEHGEVTGVLVEGHTDDVGGAARNLRLSRARAEAVRSYLVGKGVEASRLEAKGFGETRPIADNKTAKGREDNRRVEFQIK